MVNKLRPTGSLVGRKAKHQVLTEGKLDEIGAWLEHAPRKSLRRSAQEIRISKLSA
jgi:hypothetical protein